MLLSLFSHILGRLCIKAGDNVVKTLIASVLCSLGLNDNNCVLRRRADLMSDFL